jgi:ketosteroid isomerase-like protein
MKRIAVAVCVVGLAFGVFIPAQTQTRSVEQELIKLETKWLDDGLKHDVTTIDKMLADEFTSTFDGVVYTKAELLEYFKSFKEEFSIVQDEWTVHVYGDAAVVTARNTRKWKSDGKEVTSHDRFTDTWIKRDGRWQCVAAHGSTVPQK